MNEKAAAQNGNLFEAAIDRENGLRNDVFVVNIGGDTDDAVWHEKTRLFEIGPVEELQHGIRPIDMPIDRILIGEHALCERLADDNHRLFIFIILVIERIEIAAGNDRNPKRRKESRRDDTPLRPRILYTGGMDVSVAENCRPGAVGPPAPLKVSDSRPS